MWLARAKSIFDNEEKSDPEAELKLDWENIFHLKTIDGILYEFEVETAQNVISVPTAGFPPRSLRI